MGLITKCVPHETLLAEATAVAEGLIAEGGGARRHMGEADTAMLKAVNDRESQALADAFLSADFLRAQANFLSSKGKTGPALAFKTLVLTRPLWALLL